MREQGPDAARERHSWNSALVTVLQDSRVVSSRLCAVQSVRRMTMLTCRIPARSLYHGLSEAGWFGVSAQLCVKSLAESARAVTARKLASAGWLALRFGVGLSRCFDGDGSHPVASRLGAGALWQSIQMSGLRYAKCPSPSHLETKSQDIESCKWARVRDITR